MRTPQTEAHGSREEAPPVDAIDAGAEAKTQFHAQGTIPPVGAPQEAAPAERASASDMAFGDVAGGGGRAAAEPDQMIEFIESINATAGAGNWSGVYNDTAVLRALPDHGLTGKVDTRAQDGTHNFHGALNLHIHLYLRPPADWVPGMPDPASVPKIDPATESH